MRVPVCIATLLVLSAPVLGHPATSEDSLHDEGSLAAKTSTLISMLQTIRSQCALYANQHNDEYPDLAHQGWRQLVETTDFDGMRPGESDIVYGPYLQRVPVNPLTGSWRVCLTTEVHPDAGWAVDPDTHMFYAVVSDQQAGCSGLDVVTEENPWGNTYVYSADVAQAEVGLRADFAVLRNAIDLYAIEHGGQYPSCDDITEQLTLYTNSAGEVSGQKTGRYIFGPYIRQIPEHPVTGEDQICPMEIPGAYAGWAYNEVTGEIRLIADLSTLEGKTLAVVWHEDVVVFHSESELDRVEE